MLWTSLDSWIVAIAAVNAVACALLGVFLVLRRMSMMGDALSHAVLPGLAVAFLLTGSRASLPMFAGAVVAGLFTAVAVQRLRRAGDLEEGAAMGVVFTTLFAAGLLLIVRAADKVDLDPSCVLYGSLELAVLDSISMFGAEVPRAFILGSGMLLVNFLVVVLLFKEWKVTSFDPELAAASGISPGRMHYLLMTLVAASCVAAFESVGSILVIAMFIVPAAAARLCVDRLGMMLLLASGFAVLSAGFGHAGAIAVPGWFGRESTNSAGMIAVAAGMLFGLALVFSPRQGLLLKLLRRKDLGRQVRGEDILAMLYRAQEKGEAAQLDPATDRQTRAAISRLLRKGLLRMDQAGLTLTARGEEAAQGLVRSHRLWEGYLVQRVGLPPEAVHASAEKLEHVTDVEMRGRLAELTGQPERDPHDKAIPEEPRHPR